MSAAAQGDQPTQLHQLRNTGAELMTTLAQLHDALAEAPLAPQIYSALIARLEALLVAHHQQLDALLSASASSPAQPEGERTATS